MAFVRDKDAHTRGIGAIAALDRVSAARRRQARARAHAMAARDRQLALAALGAVNLRYTGGSRGSGGTGISFESGTTSTPPPPGGGGVGPGTKPISTRITRAGVQAPRPTVATQTTISPPRTPGKTTTVNDPPPSGGGSRPPPPPPPPSEPEPTYDEPSEPSEPSGGGGGGGGGVTTGGRGGGGGYAGGSRGEAIDPEPMPDVVDVAPTPSSSSSSSVSGKTLLIGAGVLLGAYLLLKKG